LVSQYFQQYFTQTIFRQFFVDPVLFYKYIYPVVLQFNTGFTGTEKTLVVPEIYSHLVPEIYRNTIVPEVYKNVVPSIYSGMIPEVYGKGMNTEEILHKMIVEGKQVYGNVYVDELLRKVLLGNVYGTGMNTGVYGNTNVDVLRKILLGNVYGTGMNTGFYGNNVDLLRKILLGNVYGTGMTGGYYGNGLGKLYNVNKYYGGLEGNTFTGIHKVAPVVFDRLFKDILEGKITMDDIKDVETTGMVGDKFVEKVNKIVDPITGEIKFVTEKIVKPVDTVVVEGENMNDVLLNKMLKKTTFNKL